MSIYTPLVRGEIISASRQTIIRATGKFAHLQGDHKSWINKVFGFAAQWAHDEVILERGGQLTLLPDNDPLDRILEPHGLIEDDKLSIFDLINQKPSGSHTAGVKEHPQWDKWKLCGQDVFLNLFTQVGFEEFAFRYEGTVSWIKCREAGMISKSQHGSTEYLMRDISLQRCSVDLM